MTANHVLAIKQRSSDIHSPFLGEKSDGMSAATCTNTVLCERGAGLPGGETPKAAAAATVKRGLETPAATGEKNQPVCCRIALLRWSSSSPWEVF